eukprot:11678450-Prorocentrum_lima.AAC.1
MTSSLVGSEMCIRDRRNSSDDKSSPETQGSQAKPQLTSKAEGQHREPVSYTHLTLPTICSV